MQRVAFLAHMVPLRLWSILVLALAPYSLAQDTAGPTPGTPAATPAEPAHRAMAARHTRWLDDHAVLLTFEERSAFERLERDYRRDAFIERFWEVRDPHPESVLNELRDAWEARLSLARERYGTLHDVRAQVLLLVGEPAERRRTDCPDLLRPAEVWSLAPTEGLPGAGAVVFVKR
jgi:GWxTD domain-containing protein